MRNKPSRLLIVGDDDDWSDDRRTITVVDDEAPQATGLVDENGTPLRRVRHPIGFMR
jgi:hypothetical protein